MRRELLPVHSISDMTMSMMHQKQDEACMERLLQYPSVSLFDNSATQADVMLLLQHSYPETDNSPLITLDELRRNIKKRIPLEAKYLSEGEISLLEALLVQDGEIFLEDWDDLSSAEALLKRLWCTLLKEDDELVICLPWELQMPIARVFQQKKTEDVRKKLHHLGVVVGSVLYLMGFTAGSEIEDTITNEIMRRKDDTAHLVAKRYLMAAYEYDTDAIGQLLLLHPGLTSVSMIVKSRMNQEIGPLGQMSEAAVEGLSGAFPQEIPLLEHMVGVLIGALRPEYNPVEATQDLHMLIKQGATIEDLKKLLSSMLAVLPTRDMTDCLQRLYEGTPRWAAQEIPLVH